MIFLNFEKLKFTSLNYTSLRKLQLPSVINTQLTIKYNTKKSAYTDFPCPSRSLNGLYKMRSNCDVIPD